MQGIKMNQVKVIILAAGSGTRLRPLTDDAPKCMVMVNGTRIIDYILSNIDKVGIKNIKVIGGYKFDVLQNHLVGRNLELIENKDYAKTNMVTSFFCALEQQDFEYDIIISYSDIMYNSEILAKLVSCPDDISVVIDKDWEHLWRIRMDDPLADAETLKISSNGCISEIGDMPISNRVHEIVIRWDITKNISKDEVFDHRIKETITHHFLKSVWMFVVIFANISLMEAKIFNDCLRVFIRVEETSKINLFSKCICEIVWILLEFNREEFITV